jgi:hypothetical protein
LGLTSVETFAEVGVTETTLVFSTPGFSGSGATKVSSFPTDLPKLFSATTR